LIGFRTVELAQHTYGPNIKGLSFYFVVNGHPMFVKGSNWVPPDEFYDRLSDERLERLLRSAQLANMNILRVSGAGVYERDSFYEMTDRLGIMVWHDFMFACSFYPVDEPFLTNVRNEVIYQMKRLQSHASLIIWVGNCELEVAIAQNWYSVPADRMPKVKDDYRKLNLDVIMRTVQEVDKGDNRPFVVSTPSNGLESISENYTASNPQDSLYG
jgi:beta-mannosidase